jgi:hypothetical protein
VLQCHISSNETTWRRTVATLVVVVFLVRLFGAALLISLASPAAGTSWIPICTADGLKWIELDQSGKPVSDEPPPDRPCPFCTAGANGSSFLLPAAPWLLVPAIAIAVVKPAWSDRAPGLRLAARPPPSRAPPARSL